MQTTQLHSFAVFIVCHIQMWLETSYFLFSIPCKQKRARDLSLKKTTKSCAQFQCYKGRKYGTLAYQHPFIEIIKLDQIIRKIWLVLVLNKMSLCGFVGHSPANQLRHVNTINYLCNNIVFFLKDLQWVRYGFSVI